MMIPINAGKRSALGFRKRSFPISMVERAIASASAGRTRCLVTGVTAGKASPAARASRKIAFRLRRRLFKRVISRHS